MALTFQQKLMFQTHLGVILCRAQDADGASFFHFILADRKVFVSMQSDFNNSKVVDFTSYGKIIHSGWGDPSDDDQEIANQLAQAA